MTDTPRGLASLKLLTPYHWFVFIVCCMAWDMDCMDQQLFVLAKRPAMMDLLPKPTDSDPRLPEFSKKMIEQAQSSQRPIPTMPEVKAALFAADVGDAATLATSIFMIGWAIGGIGFGMMGDRVGRVKTLMLTILLYAFFTGLSALSQSTLDFYLYRFLTGLGVGGVFAAAVTLLAETMPDAARPFALGAFQASSVLGNCTAALLSMWFGSLKADGTLDNATLLGFPLTPWRLMFVVGIIPGLLVVLIQSRLKEPAKWLALKAAGLNRKRGLFSGLFDDPRWRRNAIFGLMLAISGVIGLWGIGFFSVDLQQYVADPQYKAEAVQQGLMTQAERDANNLPEAAVKYVQGQKAYWAGITSLVQNAGAFFGIFAFAIITVYLGRRRTFAVFFILAGLSTAGVFLFLKTWSDIFWMVPIMGFFQLAIFGGYAIYFPELFPTSLRSTGTSFCYNVGRLIAAGGPFMLGQLTSGLYAHHEAPLPLRYAGVTMCAAFGLGLIALLFLPETQGKPLPEETES